METYHNLFVLDIIDQNWEIYPIIWNNQMTDLGKLIALRGNLYYFHKLANLGAINRILKNGTQIDLKMDKLYEYVLNGSDSDEFNIHHIQLVPFSRRFFENVKNDSLNMKYTKFV